MLLSLGFTKKSTPVCTEPIPRVAASTTALDAIWRSLISQSVGLNTSKQYASGQKLYIAFCASLEASPCPATELLLLRFVAAQSSRVSGYTIQSYLSAIRFLHITNGFDNPITSYDRLRLVIRALKKAAGPKRQRAPITIAILLQIHKQMNCSLYNDILFWAMTCIGFFGFLRVSEFTTDGEFDEKFDLSFSDLAFSRDLKSLSINLKSSKTDPFRQGVQIIIGRTDGVLCPIQAMLRYIAARSSHSGALFKFKNGRSASRSWFSKRLKQVVAKSGFQGDFTSHSLRIGAASEASKAGFPDSLVQVLGRWASDSFKLYIRIPRDTLTNSARCICRGSLTA